MSKDYIWIKKKNCLDLHVSATASGRRSVYRVGSIHYSELRQKYFWDQRILARNFDSESLRLVVDKLDELNNKEDS